MQRTVRLCRWIVGAVALGGIIVSGVVWSVLEGVGPVADYRIEIGNENRPLDVSLHQLVVAWEREHGLMRGGELPDSRRKSLFAFARASVTRKKVEAKVRVDTAWIPLPNTWHASLVTTITNAHMQKGYFGPPAMTKPVLADMVAVEN